MKLACRIFREGKFWAAEIPALDVSTQGYTEKEAQEMVMDLIQTMADDTTLGVTVTHEGGDAYAVAVDNTRVLVRLLLSSARQRTNKSLRELTRDLEKLKLMSHNTYARYERGEVMPSAERLFDLLRAIDPDRDLVLSR
jgi:hypothetical protein